MIKIWIKIWWETGKDDQIGQKESGGIKKSRLESTRRLIDDKPRLESTRRMILLKSE